MASEAVEWFYMKAGFSVGVFMVVFAVNGVEADYPTIMITIVRRGK